MKYEVYIMQGKSVFKRMVVDATNSHEALFIGRMEKKRLYNNARRLMGANLKLTVDVIRIWND